MSVLTAYNSTVNETKEEKPGKVLTVHICKKGDAKDAINKNLHDQDEVQIEFAEPYMASDYSAEHMDVWIPTIDDSGIHINSALQYALTSLPLERYNVDGDIEVIALDIPKKIWKKMDWIVTEIAYTFATRFPSLTIIAVIPASLKDNKEVLSIFKRK